MDTLITNGLIIDGTGGEPYFGDVYIKGAEIAAVGNIPVSARENALCIDARGRCVTPGFVDIHRHCDYAALSPEFGEIELSQGITTAVSGACGLTPYPAAPALSDTFAPVMGEPTALFPSYRAYKDMLSARGLPINIGAMIGSCSVRASVKGMERTPFSKAEMNRAKGIIASAMEDGALGVSLGIMYAPEFYSSSEEIAQVVQAAARYGGVLTAHIRGEGDSLEQSVREAAYIAELAGMPLEISHFKCCGAENFGRGINEAIKVIDHARRNTDITVDFYPYSGGASTLVSLIPPDFPKERMSDPLALEDALSRKYANWDNYVLSLGFERIILNALTGEYEGYNGRSVAEICAELGQSPYGLIAGILAEFGARAGVIVMSMSESDVDTVAKLPYASVISDALYPSERKNAHPRLYSAFPKIIRDFVLSRRILTLEDAVRKMTSLPAKRLNIHRRGLLEPGYRADINVFKPENVRDNADFGRSGQLAGGMDYVLVNGGIAYENGRVAGHFGNFVQNRREGC